VTNSGIRHRWNLVLPVYSSVGVEGLQYVGVRRNVRKQNIKMIRKERDKAVTYITYLLFLLFVNNSYCTTHHGQMASIPVVHLVGIDYYIHFFFFFLTMSITCKRE
jgi:hypothetical protein